MPIYMDLHMIPGVKARGVAEAHRMDVLMEDAHQCKCMTYWVDESRGNVFCLIDAPNKEAVVRLHTEAHGLIPHRIIEVEPALVESFLGRVSDPQEVETTPDGLKIFHDPSFRVILVIRMEDPVLLRHRLGEEEAAALMNRCHEFIRGEFSRHGGSEASYGEKGYVVSFTAAIKALACALSLHEQSAALGFYGLFHSGLDGGEPISKDDNLFGDTCTTATRLCFLRRGLPAVTAAVRERVPADLRSEGSSKWTSFSTADVQFIHLWFDTLEKNWNEPAFDLDDYCAAMAMSNSQLYRKTTTCMGMAPNELIRTYRLEKAKDLLRSRRHSIAETSFLSGFTSASYFTKCFKSHFGILPQAYIDLLK